MTTTPVVDDGNIQSQPDNKKVKNLIAQRRGHKAFATKMMNKAQYYFDDRTNANRNEMVATRKILSDRSFTIETIDNLILSELDDEDEIEKEVLDSSDYNARIQVVLVNLSDVIEEKDGSRLSQGSNNGDSPSKNNAKLPKLLLKSFSGDVLLFQEFWECYCSAVHDNENVDKVSKFNYLRSLLEGAAAATISGLPLKITMKRLVC